MILVIVLLNVYTSMSTDATEGTDKARMLTVVDALMKAASGQPTNCRRFVDLFIASGRLILPNLDASKTQPRMIQGQRSMFAECEALTKKYSSIDAFATGKIFVAGHSASFERTLVFVTSETRCRFVLRGITSISVNDQFEIVEMRDIFDPQHLSTFVSNCAFPGSSTEDSTKETAASKGVDVISAKDEI